MKSTPTQLEPYAIRRAEIAERDKVRYRVYSTPTEFIAVIAENALLAVKLSGISKPHKIVRDLPTEGIAIEAKKMARIEDVDVKNVAFSMVQSSAEALSVKDMPTQKEVSKEAQFKPITLTEMQSPSTVRARILSPELLMEIIESHVRGHIAQLTPSAAPAPTPVPEATPVYASLGEPLEAVEAAPPPEEVSLTPQERLLALADEVLPPATGAPVSAGGSSNTELSPDEVDKLLNE